jgi:hypothetical protein
MVIIICQKTIIFLINSNIKKVDSEKRESNNAGEVTEYDTGNLIYTVEFLEEELRWLACTHFGNYSSLKSYLEVVFFLCYIIKVFVSTLLILIFDKISLCLNTKAYGQT